MILLSCTESVNHPSGMLFGCCSRRSIHVRSLESVTQKITRNKKPSHKVSRQKASDICAGAIDGLRVWIEEPRKIDCGRMKTGKKQFFCGRKYKFGWNLQAVCDSNGEVESPIRIVPLEMQSEVTFARSVRSD